MKNKIFVVLGNHLFNPNFFSQYKNDHIFYMAEDLGLCTYEKHHKQKILLFLSSMRSFCDELKEKNFEVIYKKIEENDFELDYLEKLKIIITEKKIETVSVFDSSNRFAGTRIRGSHRRGQQSSPSPERRGKKL